MTRTLNFGALDHYFRKVIMEDPVFAKSRPPNLDFMKFRIGTQDYGLGTWDTGLSITMMQKAVQVDMICCVCVLFHFNHEDHVKYGPFSGGRPSVCHGEF